jgi:hypothetical protein
MYTVIIFYLTVYMEVQKCFNSAVGECTLQFVQLHEAADWGWETGRLASSATSTPTTHTLSLHQEQFMYIRYLAISTTHTPHPILTDVSRYNSREQAGD